jgi:hypothetical protein
MLLFGPSTQNLLFFSVALCLSPCPLWSSCAKLYPVLSIDFISLFGYYRGLHNFQ